jgi:hypothetical protein
MFRLFITWAILTAFCLSECGYIYLLATQSNHFIISKQIYYGGLCSALSWAVIDCHMGFISAIHNVVNTSIFGAIIGLFIICVCYYSLPYKYLDNKPFTFITAYLLLVASFFVVLLYHCCRGKVFSTKIEP